MEYRFEKYSLRLIAFTLPLQVMSFYIGFSVLFVRIVMIISMAVYLGKFLLNGKIIIQKTFVDMFLLTIIIVNFFVTLFAVDMLLSFKDAMLQFMIIFYFFYIVQLLKNEQLLETAISAYIFTAFLIAAYGIFQQIGFIFGWDTALPFIEYFSYNELAKDPNSKFWAVEEISSLFIRIKGTFLDTNTFAGYIVSAFALAATRLLYYFTHYDEGKKQQLYMFLSIFFLSAIFISMSRSALIGLFFVFIILLWYYRKDIFKEYTWFKLLFPLLLIIAVILIIIPEMYDLVEGVITSFFSSSKGSIRAQSARLHLRIALEGLKMFVEYPFTGVGLSNFRILFAKNVHLWYGGATNKAMMPHSIFLSFFAESGIIGAIVNYSFIFMLIATTMKTIKRTIDTKMRCVLTAVFAAYIGTLGCNIFYQYYLMEFVWFIIALNVSAVIIADRMTVQNKKPEAF